MSKIRQKVKILVISATGLTTLSLRVSAKFTIRQGDTEYESGEGDLGMNFWDDEHCINTGGGYTEVTILVCRPYRLVIYGNLKQRHEKITVRNNNKKLS